MFRFELSYKLRVVKSLIAGLAVLSSGTNFSYAQSNLNPERVVKGQYLLSAASPALRGKAEDALEEAANKDLTVIDQSINQQIFVVEVSEDLSKDGVNDASDDVRYDSSKDLCEKLKKARREKIKEARKAGKLAISAMRHFLCSPNMIYQVSDIVIPNDPYFNQLWGMHQTIYNPNFDINAPQAWQLSTGVDTTVVAVIDTGVDYNHEDLKDNMWINPREIAGNSIDDDSNGYVDDVYGINAINGSGNPIDDNGHGTHCSGTIAGRGNNGIGVTGVSWRSKIIAVKFLSSSGGTSSDAVEAIDYVTNLKLRGEDITLSSNSWGGQGWDPYIEQAITRAKNAGLLFVAAAGNDAINIDNTSYFPGGSDLENVITVGAIANGGSLANFSNFGVSKVDISAPGVSIVSTWLGGGYHSISGTSMATPHVAGALALLKSYAPHLTWSQLKTKILDHSTIIPSLNGVIAGSRFLNIYASLVSVYQPGQTPVPTSTPTLMPTAIPSSTPTAVPTSTPTATPTSTPTPGWYVLSGTIRAGGAGVVGAKVEIEYQTNKYTVYTDSQGRYTFSDILGPITYSVKVTQSGYTFSPSSIYLSSNRTLDFEGYPNSYILSGKVITTEKEPLAGVTISLNEEIQPSVITDSEGKFKFSVPINFNYKLKAIMTGRVFNHSELSGTTYGDVARTFVAKVD